MSPAWVARALPAATMVAVAPTLVARSQVSFSVRAMLARVAKRSWEFPCGGVPERRRRLAIRLFREVRRAVQKGVGGGGGAECSGQDHRSSRKCCGRGAPRQE